MEWLKLELTASAKKILESLGMRTRGKANDINVARQNSLTFPGMFSFGSAINYKSHKRTKP